MFRDFRDKLSNSIPTSQVANWAVNDDQRTEKSWYGYTLSGYFYRLPVIRCSESPETIGVDFSKKMHHILINYSKLKTFKCT